MVFQHGLSGLNAAARNLDIIGHNVANANTIGAKVTRAEFADRYANAVGGGGTFTGLGVT
ncbi:MAG: flagellar basal body protein, partial [Burkholderiaceae bacterium]